MLRIRYAALGRTLEFVGRTLGFVGRTLGFVGRTLGFVDAPRAAAGVVGRNFSMDAVSSRVRGPPEVDATPREPAIHHPRTAAAIPETPLPSSAVRNQ